jgi:hypothetical protein
VATDGGSAFPWLLQNMLPGVPHILCLYHIHANLNKQLGGMQQAGRTAFKAQFARCAYTATTATAFDKEWDALLKLVSGRAKLVEYLTRELHGKRTQWARAWTQQYCTFGAKSTQRVESVNRVVKHFMPGNASLAQLFTALHKIFTKQIRRRQQRVRDDQIVSHKHEGAIYKAAAALITKQAAELLHQQENRCLQYIATQHPTRPERPAVEATSSFTRTAVESGIVAHQAVDSRLTLIERMRDVPRTTAGHSALPTATLSSGGYSVRLRGAEEGAGHWVCVDDCTATCSDCDFAQNYMLPCRHIFAVNLVQRREEEGFRLEQCHPRWHLAASSTTTEASPFFRSTTSFSDGLMVEAKEEDTTWSQTSATEPSQDMLYNRFMANASRLADFLKPHGDSQFKRVEAWMESCIKELAAVDLGGTVIPSLLHQHTSELFLTFCGHA